MQGWEAQCISVGHSLMVLVRYQEITENTLKVVQYNFGSQVWQLLGVISNTKPSAIFRCQKNFVGHWQDLIKYLFGRIGRLKKNAGDESTTNSFMELGQVPR